MNSQNAEFVEDVITRGKCLDKKSFFEERNIFDYFFQKSLSSLIAQLENVSGFTADMELEYQMALGLAAKLVRNNWTAKLQ